MKFRNQSKGIQSVPDAEISAHFQYLFEVKTARRAVRAGQLRAHVGALRSGTSDARLFVISPDEEEPEAVHEVRAVDPRVNWFSFRMLDDAIAEVLRGRGDEMADRERFLLRELRALFEADGLLGLPENTVIVAARSAYPQYLRHGAYVCAPGRRFRQGIQYLGFYTEKEIKPEVARIQHIQPVVSITPAGVASLREAGDSTSQRLAVVAEGFLSAPEPARDGDFQIILLSPPDSPETVLLAAPVPHLGRHAWTQNQRYVRLEQLRAGPKDTEVLSQRLRDP